MTRSGNSKKIPELALSLSGLAQAPCLDYLATLKVTERKRLLARVEALGSGLTREGDFTVRGTDDRDWQVAILGLHAAEWWIDHAVCEVKVVALRPADR